MSYTPTTWVEGVTKLGPTNLNHMEAGIAAATTAPVTIPASVSADTGIVPAFSISRLISHNNTAGDFTGDGVANFAALSVSNTGAASATNGVQPVAVYGFSSNQGSQASNGTGGDPDSCGVYGSGYITNGGTGLAAGGFFYAQRAAAAGAGIITAVQIALQNDLNAASYSPTAVTDTLLWLSHFGAHQAGSAILIGPADTGAKFDVGIGFMGNTSGAVTNASIRDDGNAASCIILNGTHSGYGIDFNGGTFTSGAIRLGNSNVVLGSSAGVQFGTATTQKLAFYGSTPLAQASSTGTSTGFTAGGGTTVTDSSTFTGAVGSTAYRISDIVKHLKNLGLIAS